MSELKNTVKNILAGNNTEAEEELKTNLYSRVHDHLKTKKMEISAKWLNGIEAPEDQ
jgi:hypothetical protein